MRPSNKRDGEPEGCLDPPPQERPKAAPLPATRIGKDARWFRPGEQSTRGEVSVRLASGEIVTLAGGDAEAQLYDELWQIQRRGAVAAIMKLSEARRLRSNTRLVMLDEYETSALREALINVPDALVAD